MIFTAEHPGTWKEFMKKSQNRDLPIMEARQKYLKEQLDYENQLSIYLNWNRHNNPKGRPSTSPESTPEQELLTEASEPVITEDGINLIAE